MPISVSRAAHLFAAGAGDLVDASIEHTRSAHDRKS
jgi:hypothetical protein